MTDSLRFLLYFYFIMNLKKFKESILFFWIDELEFLIDLEKFIHYEDLDFNLNDTNTSFWYINILNVEFKYSKIYPKWYKDGLKFETIIDNKIIDCFAIIRWRNNNIIKSKDKCVFYSSFFVLERLEKLSFSLLDFLHLFSYSNSKLKLHRIDIALDLKLDIKTINQKIFSKVNFFAQIGKDLKNEKYSQTYYINNPRSNNNRKFIFRIYDKILDSFKKQKTFLFPHLKNNDNVRRIELELRPIECQRFIDYDIYDIIINNDNCLQKIFFNYFNKYSDIKINYDKIKLIHYTNDSVDLNDFYLNYNQLPEYYVSRAHWYINNIINNVWIDAFFDVIIKKLYTNPNYINNSLDLFDKYIKYLKKRWIAPYLIQKIIKNNNIKTK